MNSKNKGKSFERKIANLLSARFEERTGIKKSFRRNADSGSFFGGKNQARLETHDTEKATLGDVTCPADFIYTVECKHYKTSPSLKSIMQQEVKDWDGWIEQAEQDSRNSGKKMLLIIKYNNVDEITITDDPVPNAYNMPYRRYHVSSLKSLLMLEDDHFFSAVTTQENDPKKTT